MGPKELAEDVTNVEAECDCVTWVHESLCDEVSVTFDATWMVLNSSFFMTEAA